MAVPNCDQCGGAVHFGKYDPDADKALPGDYRIVAIRREGGGYGRSASWPSVYAHIGECEAAWRAANGNGALGLEVKLVKLPKLRKREG